MIKSQTVLTWSCAFICCLLDLQGMVDPGEQVSITLQREFSEEALNSLSVTKAEKIEIHKRVTKLFQSPGFQVSRWYRLMLVMGVSIRSKNKLVEVRQLPNRHFFYIVQIIWVVCIFTSFFQWAAVKTTLKPLKLSLHLLVSNSMCIPILFFWLFNIVFYKVNLMAWKWHGKAL